MGTDLTGHAVVPVANESDARTTAELLNSYRVGEVTVLHVVEKGGRPGQDPGRAVGARRRCGLRCIPVVLPGGGRGDHLQTDVVEAIVDVASDVGATAIVFHPRGGSRILQFLAGDRALRLITEADRPVVALGGRAAGRGT